MKFMKKIKYFFLLTLFFILTSCIYKMPSDDTASLIPITNNPKVFQDDAQSSIPAQGGF